MKHLASSGKALKGKKRIFWELIKIGWQIGRLIPALHRPLLEATQNEIVNLKLSKKSDSTRLSDFDFSRN